MRHILLFFLCLTNFVFAQETSDLYSLERGDDFKLPKKYGFLDLIGNEKDGFVQLSYKTNTEIGIEVLDGSGIKHISDDVFDVSKFGKVIANERFLEVKGNYYWFYFSIDEQGFHELNMLKFDIVTKKFNNNVKKVIAEKKHYRSTKVEFPDRANVRNMTFSYNISNDSSKIMISYKLSYEQIKQEDKVNERYGYYVFDSDMNLLWNKEIDVPFKESQIIFYDNIVNSAGDVCFLIGTYNPNLPKEDRFKNIDYQLAYLKKGDSVPRVGKFELESKYVTKMKLNEVSNSKLAIVGFYSTVVEYTEGAIVIDVILNNESTPLFSKHFVKIPMSVHEKNWNIKCKISEIEIEQLFFEKNEFIIVGTSRYGTMNVYVDKPIVFMKLDKDMVLKGINVIPRKIGRINVIPIGSEVFYIHKIKNDYCIFYQDGLYKRTLDEKPSEFKSDLPGNLSIVRIKSNGEMVKDFSLFDSGDAPQYFMRVSDNRLLIKGGTYYKPLKMAAINIKN